MNIREFYEKKLNDIKHKVEMTDTHSLIWDEMFVAYKQLLNDLMTTRDCVEDMDFAIKEVPNKKEIHKKMLDFRRLRLEKELVFKIPDDVHKKWCEEEFKDE